MTSLKNYLNTESEKLKTLKDWRTLTSAELIKKLYKFEETNKLRFQDFISFLEKMLVPRYFDGVPLDAHPSTHIVVFPYIYLFIRSIC